MVVFALATLLAISLTLNAHFFLRLRRKLHRPDSVELKEFLMDVKSGLGMLAVARINPDDILLRSPKR